MGKLGYHKEFSGGLYLNYILLGLLRKEFQND